MNAYLVQMHLIIANNANNNNIKLFAINVKIIFIYIIKQMNQNAFKFARMNK